MITRLVRAMRTKDDGIALAAVLGIGLVLTILVASILTLSTSGAVKSSSDRNLANATAAAYAGLAEYQSRLTANNAYETYGVPTSFNTGSTFTGTDSNPAFGTTAGGTWATVANSGGAESFRYEVDNSQFTTSGILRLRVTGRAGTAVRSLVASLKGTGFIDYLYFTDYESSNPAITGETQTGGGNTSKPCLSEHITDSNYNAAAACKPVQFITNDILRGPVRTNDEFTICGAEFVQSVQSTAANGVYNLPSGCGSTPIFDSGGPQKTGSLDLPATNNAMLQETRNDLTASTVPRPGCLYTGPTSITFTSNGQMTVISPWTLATQISIAANGKMSGTATGTAAAECGTLSALHSAAGATVAIPANNLIYVQNVPNGATNTNTDPNYWGPTAVPTSPSTTTFCTTTTTTTTGSGWYQTTKTTTTYNNGLGYPQTNEYVGSVGAAAIYGCRAGDAFVKGAFHGALTVGAQNDLYVTGNITYQNATTDILGLVGQTAVTLWNPVSCSSTSGGICSTSSGSSTLLARAKGDSVEIDAAIASNGGTFQVQNYGYGAQLGTLTVKGSIAQEFRGAVGVSYGAYQTGFTKDYGYDSRLRNTAPPKFLQPVSTTYGPTTEVVVKPAYTAAGAPIS